MENDPGKALEHCKKAIRDNPNNAKAHSNLGAVYSRLGLYDEAIEALKLAIRFQPNQADAHFNLAIAYLGIGNKVSAIREYEILKTLDNSQANKLIGYINRQ